MVWGKPETGAWANAVEEEEQQHGKIQAPAAAPERDFPSLGVAATVKETKKDKKKKQTMSLSDFMSSGVGSGRRGNSDPILDLPTAPRGRVEGEEEPSTLGGGFRAYGGDRYGGGGGRGGGGRFDSDERRPRRERDDEGDMGPSRADTGDWGAKQFVPSSDSDRGGFRDRGGFGGGDRGGFRDREDRPPREFEDGPSRADTSDWGAKQFVPSSDRSGGFRDRGDRDSFREAREPREPSRADVEEKWERKGGVDETKPTGFDDRPRRTFDDQPPRERRGGFADSWRGRDRSVGSGPSSRDGSRDQWRRDTPPPTNGEDAPRERPKLLLKPRTASADARAAAATGVAAEDGSRPSIFGAARPREEILKAQGRDAIQEDKRLEEAAKAALRPRRERRERADTEEETALKSKIEEVKAKAGGVGSVGSGEGEEENEVTVSEEEKSKIAEEVAALEAELAKLKVEADEKAAAEAASRGRGGARKERGGERGDRRPGSGDANGGSASGDKEIKERPAAADVRRDGGGFKKREETDANRW